MNRKFKRVIKYIKMTLLLMGLGAAVIYFAGKPLADYVTAHGNMVIVKGSPDYPDADTYNIAEPIVNTENSMDQSEILTPELNTQYGTITCDTIKLSAPVYYGDSDEALLNGVGQYPQSAMPGEGKPILIGGHDGTFFAPLENIKVGDVVSITTDYGKYDYKVAGTEVAQATDTKAYNLAQDKEQLILYTCYPIGKVTGDRSERYFVYCDRISESAE